METIKDDGDGVLVILFEPGEIPDIPSGYEVVELTGPSYFRGLLNPGRMVCRFTGEMLDRDPAGCVAQVKATLNKEE